MKEELKKLISQIENPETDFIEDLYKALQEVIAVYDVQYKTHTKLSIDELEGTNLSRMIMDSEDGFYTTGFMQSSHLWTCLFLFFNVVNANTKLFQSLLGEGAAWEKIGYLVTETISMIYQEHFNE